MTCPSDSLMFCAYKGPVENGDTEMTAEEPWDQKDEEPTEEEPGGGDGGPGEAATPPEMMMMEEEEEVLVPKVPAVQPDAPKKEHINVVFIGHVGQCCSRLPLLYHAGGGVQANISYAS